MQPLTRSRPRSRFFGASGPSFALDFVNGTNALDPRVTFTRASSATYFDSAGVLQSAANNVPRFDYNPATLAARGLLIEEARTNSIRNNTMVGAVAGTPGTAPTNWTLAAAANGIDREVVGTGTENGITYIDVRFYGTATAFYTGFSIFEGVNIVVASSGQTWTDSAYFKLQAGATTNVTNLQLFIDEVNSGGSLLARTTTTISPTSAALSTQRVVATRTFTDATTAFARTGFRFEVANGLAIDITLRIGLPQLELGAFATSVIPTTTTALTRSADVASVNTLSPWYNAAEGTLYVEASPQASNVGGFNLAELSTDINNRIGLYKLTSTGNASLAVLNGGATQASTNSGAWTATGKLAGAYATNDFASSLNGSVPATDTTGTLPAVTTLTLGRRTDGANILNGHLRRVSYFPRRLSNAELQTLTT